VFFDQSDSPDPCKHWAKMTRLADLTTVNIGRDRRETDVPGRFRPLFARAKKVEIFFYAAYSGPLPRCGILPPNDSQEKRQMTHSNDKTMCALLCAVSFSPCRANVPQVPAIIEHAATCKTRSLIQVPPGPPITKPLQTVSQMKVSPLSGCVRIVSGQKERSCTCTNEENAGGSNTSSAE